MADIGHKKVRGVLYIYRTLSFGCCANVGMNTVR
jgi:hypothetical protein